MPLVYRYAISVQRKRRHLLEALIREATSRGEPPDVRVMPSVYSTARHRIDYVAMTPGGELWLMLNVPPKDRHAVYQRPCEEA